MIPSFTGVEVTAVDVDAQALRVQLANGWRVDGECGCSVVRADLPSTGVDLSQGPAPDRVEELRDAARSLEGRELADILVTREGHLGLVLVGAQLVLVAHADYESWTLVGPGGERAVCRPGGEVVMWLSADGPTEPADV